MLMQSKTDRLLINSFHFDGQRKAYLDLPFHCARIVFMVRCRMMPTKDNFPGRWKGTGCNVCGMRDTDEHLFTCPGFSDIMDDSMSLELFFIVSDLKVLESAAEKMLKVVERLEVLQELTIDDE